VAVVEVLDVLDPLLGDLHPRPVLDEELTPEAAPEREADEVARDGREPCDRDQQDHVDLALAGDEAGDHDRRLPRDQQADERPALQEAQHADEQIGPGAERRADVLQQLVEVRQREQAEAVRPHPDRGEHAADEQRRLQSPAAPDQIRQQQRRGGEPDGSHTARSFPNASSAARRNVAGSIAG
jgi:hypothetical protein